ncbi:MAG: hypothetical protein K2I00_04770 [Ruminococcus sp.]|nr:hypothetical protein [Ruminococcus sp.]
MLKEKKSRFSPVHTKDLIIGTAICILSPVPLSLIGVIFSEDDFLNCMGAGLLLIIVAVGIFLIVKSSLIKNGFSKMLEEDKFSRERKLKEKQHIGGITGSYWLIVLAGFFAYSFITSDWGRSWIAFPVAALLTPIVYQIEKHIKSK